MSANYPYLLSPMSIGRVELPNRIVRTAHATGLDLGTDGGDLAAYHERAARGGAGLTILEAAAVHPTSTGRLRFEDDSLMKPYTEMVTRLHRHPMRIFQQLVHTGRAFLTPGGDPPWSASAVPAARIVQAELSQTPLAITQDQIAHLIGCFARSAVRAVEAGVDGIEINAAHGYLLGQFMSPHTNKREDRYGGSRENRVRLLVEVLTAVRTAIGPDVVLGVRISADEMYPGSITTDESQEIVRAVEAGRLIDFLDVSLGSPMNVTKVIGGMEEPSGYELPYSRPVAEVASVPTILAGRITTLDEAEELVRDGAADLIAMARAHIADPELVVKSAAGRQHRVRPCIGCNQGCVGLASSPHARFGCTVNPGAGFEALEARYTSNSPRGQRVLVVGGGPAGMQAARTAALAGDHVVLHEASSSLGGQLKVARLAPHRARIGLIVDWLARELEELGVKVNLDSHVGAEVVAAGEWDRVVVATGSVPRTNLTTIAAPDSSIPGITRGHVLSSWEAISDTSLIGRRAVVYDDVGHHEAVSVAETLLARGCTVTFATRLNRLMPLLENARMETSVKKRLYVPEFRFIGDVKLGEIAADHVLLNSLYGLRDERIDADLVVVVGANVSQREIADRLQGAVDVAVVGDALGPRFLQLAILEGHRAGLDPLLLPESATGFQGSPLRFGQSA
ncbi:2,4-dienoyl-CoA reductase-like NADH-dependent reductase (Old Yellow Enzyme family)/microcompartment protein CcmK/EutM [Rhodococcus sp. 27YEA15]|uniref:oxidoreductase n=1 Tax=Rhodococcus sp. 27YEA15 TaxID=3156259 RepID=UPI003C7D21AE